MVRQSGTKFLKELDAVINIIEMTDFIYNTNAIEGSKLSYDETARVLSGKRVKDRSRFDIMAAQNHPAAIDIVRNLSSNTSHKITESDIKHIHSIVAKGLVANPGEYREQQVWIGGTTFVPPAHYDIPKYMPDLIALINRNPDKLTLVELAAHVHYGFVWIHPFIDINGRMARLLLNYVLLRSGYTELVVIKNVDRAKYMECLRIGNSGDIEPFVQFLSRSIK
jgi:Fic family protein